MTQKPWNSDIPQTGGEARFSNKYLYKYWYKFMVFCTMSWQKKRPLLIPFGPRNKLFWWQGPCKQQAMGVTKKVVWVRIGWRERFGEKWGGRRTKALLKRTSFPRWVTSTTSGGVLRGQCDSVSARPPLLQPYYYYCIIIAVVIIIIYCLHAKKNRERSKGLPDVSIKDSSVEASSGGRSTFTSLHHCVEILCCR